ncbi:MAG: hypothetical protein B7Y15_06090 [Bacteroidetes bacterium 24-39-8]|nr:MAG: hypothetical protein B7Y15_06090 [Bacteroidetes bacterium 24-39-8]OZA68279.1 MAG: hypothetical protein B7X72_02070 [Sphingobacteriia bacterium 39-39-8]
MTQLGQNCLHAQQTKHTSVIVIMADQLRADVLGKGFTPNIDALQKDAVTFNRAYCAAPLCAPSRASFFTGLYPNRTGSMINPWEKDDEVYGNTKAGIANLYGLMDAEWDSYHVGKQHFFTEEKMDKNPSTKTKWITQETYSKWMKEQGKPKPGGKMYKDVAPELVSSTHTQLRSYSTPATGLYKEGINYFLDHYLANEAIKAIQNRDTKKPLLLNAMFLAPHPPFSIPEPYYSKYGLKDFDLPENVGEWYPGQSPLQMYNLTGFIGSRYNREQWGQIWAKYLGLVKLLDDEVGRVIVALKQAGIYEQSTILFTADHGEMLGSHSLWQKMCMYEESARVPFLLKLPQSVQPAIKVSNEPISLVDFLPTVLDLNAIKHPGRMDGISLLPLIEGKTINRKAIFLQFDGNGSLGSSQRAVVMGNYKLTVDMFKDEFYVELYDLSKDFQEKENLAFNQSFSQKTNELLLVLKEHMKLSGDRVVLPAELMKKFLKNYKYGIQKSDKVQ